MLRPIDQGEEEELIIIPQEAGEADNNDKCETHKVTRVVKALNLPMIRKEFDLASARLRLARSNPDTLANQYTTPLELVLMLVNVGLFKTALNLATTFKLPYDCIFACLTTMCIRLAKSNDPESWNWLVENDLADMPVVDASPATVCWNLLQTLHEKYEKPGLTVLLKAITQKLIATGSHIPHWIVEIYKLRNPSELLRLLIKSGRVVEATTLASQQILATLGQGKEHFGYVQPLVPTAPVFCLPLLWFDRLEKILLTLGETKMYYRREHAEFQKLLNKYMSTSKRVYKDVRRIGQMKKQEMEKQNSGRDRFYISDDVIDPDEYLDSFVS